MDEYESDNIGDESYPMVELDSDEECRGQDSSDDDALDVIVRGTAEQRRRLRRRLSECSGNDSSEDDEFEKQMEAELSSTMDRLKNTAALGTSATSTSDNFYSNDYFDSDSDEEGTREEKRWRQRAVVSDADLLYDPEMDGADAAWVNAERRQRGANSAAGSGGVVATTDAVLNCPACMVTLTRDCQRHELYKHQYRAMFVTHCTVDSAATLSFPTQQQQQQRRGKGKKKTKRKFPAPAVELEDLESVDSGYSAKVARCDGATVAAETTPAPGKQQQQQQQQKEGATVAGGETAAVSGSELVPEEEVFHAVKCTECNTEVGVMDKDDVVHFYNVLASHA